MDPDSSIKADNTFLVVPSRRVRFEANPFEAAVAVLVVASAIAFLLLPDTLRESSLGEAIRWVPLWNFGYGTAGVGILLGLWFGWARIEAAGLSLLAGALTVQTLATFELRGSSALVAIVSLLSIVVASAVRIHTLVLGRRHIIVTIHRDSQVAP